MSTPDDPFSPTQPAPAEDPLTQALPRGAFQEERTPGWAGRYRLEAEVGRGGMGVVYRASDPDLGRALAVKVLLPHLHGREDVQRRFLEEARVTGQLQHPGVPPVHDLGRLPDGRLFLAMKLIDGDILSRLLAVRTSPSQDLPRFVAVFEQVCQTVAFAHRQGILHRDLKPSNVMVGAFGEVQVMDWGLAKRLRGGAVAPTAVRAQVETVLPPEESSGTQAGAILGTLAYMPPEQAHGGLTAADERADVFGLGAILCEVLTGKPPYEPTTTCGLLDKAASADLGSALARLAGCEADPELVQLARACLAPDPADRPANAAEVAGAVSAYRSGVQERLRIAELQAAEARTRAAEQRKRFRVMLALAAVILALGLVGAWAWSWVNEERRDRAQQDARRREQAARVKQETRQAVERALQDVEGSQKRGDETAARLALERAQGRLGNAELKDLRVRLEGARRNQQVVADLEQIRFKQAAHIEHRSPQPVPAADYEAAFRKFGLDLAEGSQAVRLLAASPVKEAIVVGLEAWADADQARRKLLLAMVRQADPNPWRDRLRRPISKADRAELERLAAKTDPPALSAAAVLRLGEALARAGANKTDWLRRAQRAHPGDFWINFELGNHLAFFPAQTPANQDQAIGYLRAALAARPSSAATWTLLGLALEERGDLAEALAACRKAVDLNPKFGPAHVNLARVQAFSRDPKRAVQSYEAALVLDPRDVSAWTGLGLAQAELGQLEKAVKACRKAVALAPARASNLANLAGVLARSGDHPAAEEAIRKAIALRPKDGVFRYNLGTYLVERGRLAEAVEVLGQAVELDPDSASAWNNLAATLLKLKRLEDALPALRSLAALKPNDAEVHALLGGLLLDLGQPAAAAGTLARAITLAPDSARAHADLGKALTKLGRRDEALDAFRAALRLDPGNPVYLHEIGSTLAAKGDLPAAVTAFRQSLARKPGVPGPHAGLGLALVARGETQEAIKELREAVRLRTTDATVYLTLGGLLTNGGDPAEGARLLREAVRRAPRNPNAHYNLGLALDNLGQPDEALACYREALSLDPGFAEAWCNTGLVHMRAGRFTEAVENLRVGHAVGSKRAAWPYDSALWLKTAQRQLHLEQRLPALLKAEQVPADAMESLEMARMCHKHIELYAAAARFWAHAFAAKLSLADDPRSGERFRAACAAALAGCGKGKDAPTLDDRARAALRKQALDWLRADLNAWEKLLPGAKAEDLATLRRSLGQWRQTPDLGSVRGASALKQLPPDERAGWQQLWADVDSLRDRAGG
jgi:Flp pilus assembly protein TadD